MVNMRISKYCARILLQNCQRDHATQIMTRRTQENCRKTALNTNNCTRVERTFYVYTNNYTCVKVLCLLHEKRGKISCSSRATQPRQHTVSFRSLPEQTLPTSASHCQYRSSFLIFENKIKHKNKKKGGGPKLHRASPPRHETPRGPTQVCSLGTG